MRKIFLVLLFGTVLVLPSLAFAVSPNATSTGLVPCEGPECQVCHVIELGQRIINFLVGIASFIAVVLFAYAGWLMLSAAGDTGQIGTAHGIFTNVVVGLVIVLAGWLIVDTVMKWTFQGTTDTEKGSPLYEEALKWKFGPWNEIKCAILPDYVASAPGGPFLGVGSGSSRGGGTPAGAGGVCKTGTGCSPEALKATGLFTDDAKGNAQTNVFSCLAQAESTANPNAVNTTPILPKYPNGTGACGYFQILPNNWREAKNHRGDCNSGTSCTDIACNIQTAKLLSDAQPARASQYQPWICAGCDTNGKNRACVVKYDPEQNITI